MERRMDMANYLILLWGLGSKITQYSDKLLK